MIRSQMVIPVSVLLLLATPAALQAQFSYTTNAGNTITITGYSGPGGAVTVPAFITGLPVTTIGGAAFFECTTLNSVVIPGSVASLGEAAFYCCTNLASVYFGGNAPIVGLYVFSSDSNAVLYYLPGTTGWCSPLAGLPAVPTTAQAQFNYETNGGTITVIGYTGPGGVVIIPAFINGLPVATIGEFYNFSVLCNVIIPGSVTSISSGAFNTGLTNVTIPASVTNIGDEAFRGCTSLKAINVSSQNECYSSVNGVLFNVGQSTLIQYPAGVGGSYMVPSGVTNIGDEAFIFSRSLTSVTIPGSVTSIGNNTFEECYSLTNATISTGVTSIGDAAFNYCDSLPTVTIPNSVTNIGIGVFTDCTSLSGITVALPNSFYCSVNGVLFNASQTALIEYPGGLGGNYSVPESVTSIWQDAFYGCTSLAGVTVPGSVTNIGDYAFSGCFKLTNAIISNGLTSIGQDVFEECTSLTYLPIPSSVTSIGVQAFSECTGLTSVTVPGNVTNIGDMAFINCSFLTNVFFPGNAPAVGSDVFITDNRATVYYLPGTAGWSTNFAGLPAVLWAPQIQTGGVSFGLSNNQFGFNILNGGISSIPIMVEACTDLSSPVWSPLQTLMLTNDSFYFSDPQWSNYPVRFYRISAP